MKFKKTKSKTLDINEEHIDWLLKACNNTRDKCLIAIIANYGFRIGEVASIRMCDVRPHISGTGYLITVPKSKTNPRIVLGLPVDAIIGSWFHDHPTPDNPNAHLFCNTQGEAFSTNTLRNRFASIEVKAKRIHPNLPHVHPHTLRHWCITQWNKIGLNITTIQQFSGHKTLAMVQKYCHLSNQDAISSMEHTYGITKTNDKINTLVLCPKCKKTNLPEAQFCGFCMSPMNLKSVEILKEKESKGLAKLIEMVKENPELADVLRDLKA